MRFAIVGGGNGGQTAAGDLVLRGHEVVGLHDVSERVVGEIKSRGGIEMVGEVLSGFAKITNATTDLQKAVANAEVILVITTADAHETVAANLAPVLKRGQTVVLFPGYVGGSLIFARVWKERGVPDGLRLAETSILLYATRLVGPAQAAVKAIKHAVHVAELPDSVWASDDKRRPKTDSISALLAPAFPQFIQAANVFETGLNNTNPISHVAPTLFNIGRLELNEEKDHFSFDDWITPSMRRVQEALDVERVSIGRALGIHVLTREQWWDLSYSGIQKKVTARLGDIPANARSVPFRYIDEDIPTALVPWSELGRVLGLATPVTNSLILLASIMRGRDFAVEGRTLRRLGLEGLRPSEMIALVSH